MHESLLKHCLNFHLYIFAFDDVSFTILKAIKPEKTTIVSLSEFETKELLEAKKSRTIAEYCWTCTPSTISWLLKKYNLPHCTYLDADLLFYSDPAVLVNEMIEHNKSVLITEHHFSWLPRLYEEKRGGKFCVQFVTFNNESESLKVLEQWKSQCIEWCYSRYEDGKFGDQKYLEEWPSLYGNVYVLQHQGGGLAPWNIQQYRFEKIGNALYGIVKKDKMKFIPVFYHYQYVKQIALSVFDIGWYLIPRNVIRQLYLPYIKRIIEIETTLRDTYNFKLKFIVMKPDGLKNLIKVFIKKISGYNILKIF